MFERVAAAASTPACTISDDLSPSCNQSAPYLMISLIPGNKVSFQNPVTIFPSNICYSISSLFV